MIPSLEGWPTKAKDTLSPHEVRLTLLDISPVLIHISFQVQKLKTRSLGFVVIFDVLFFSLTKTQK